MRLALLFCLLASTAHARGLELDAGRARTRVLPRGALIQVPQTVGGVPVFGGSYVMRVDEAGRVRWTGRHVIEVPDDLELSPRIPGDGQLVVFQAAPGDVHLAWRAVQGDWQLRVSETFVDAHTGRLLRRQRLDRRLGQALVYPANPAKTPQLVQVDLGVSELLTPDLAVSACVDDRTCQLLDTPLGQVNLHWCGETRRAQADASGDFVDLLPPADDRSVDDAFAEVEMYWQVSQAYAFFRGLGFGDLDQRPLRAVVNFLIPDGSNLLGAVCSGGTAPQASRLVPFDNAAFIPAGGLFGYPPEDAIIFGQGTNVDFSYDGDVIAHEFTHAVMGTISPELPGASLDEHGLDPTPGGMHEGTADYFSAAHLGDPDLGEYTGPGLGVPGALRTLTNDKTCPADLWGEAHQDGEAWGGLLWDIRSALPEGDRPTFDRAVLTVIDGLGSDSDQVSTGVALVAEVELTLGQGALVESKLAARGLDAEGECDDRVVAGSDRDTMLVLGTQDVGFDIVPGPVQLRLDNPAPASGVVVTAAQVGPADPVGSIVGEAPMVKAVVKAGAPITWRYQAGTAVHDGQDVILTLGGDSSLSGTVPVVLPAGPVYVQLASIGPGVAVSGLHLAIDATPPPESEDGGGCGCQLGGRGPGRGAALLLAGLLVVWRRRRR